MKIEITHLPETRILRDAYRKYIVTYPNGYPVHVRRITNCVSCNVEIGGYLGNGVYRYHTTNLCQTCGEKDDFTVQLCVRLTGMTPSEYQNSHGVAWNE